MTVKTENGLVYDPGYFTEMLIDSSIDRVMAIDNNWNIIVWNHTSELISGISKKKVLGKKSKRSISRDPQRPGNNGRHQIGFSGTKKLPSVSNQLFQPA